jgi:hypothetical protein
MMEKIDLGTISAMIAKVDPNDPEYFSLILTDESGGKDTIRASRGAAKSLLSHLTSILYPRAAEQVNPRTSTAVITRTNDDLPTDVAYTSVAYTNEDDPETIIIACTSHDFIWALRMSHENADDLWASLEDKLNHV